MAGATQLTAIEVLEALAFVGAAGVAGIVAEMIEISAVRGPTPTIFPALTLYLKVVPAVTAEVICLNSRVPADVTVPMSANVVLEPPPLLYTR